MKKIMLKKRIAKSHLLKLTSLDLVSKISLNLRLKQSQNYRSFTGGSHLLANLLLGQMQEN
jgi:hypothetical protein